jgi:hypothetical protein
MRDGGVPDIDMLSNPRSRRADALELQDRAMTALLAGGLLTDEAAAGLQPAAALLAALTAAPESSELAGHARALAEFRRRDGMPAHSRRSTRRRSRLLTPILSAKAAAAAVAAAAALGGVATIAYAGGLPAPAQQLAHDTIGAPSPKPSDNPVGKPAAAPSGPDATGPAAFGLCTAYSHAKAHGTAAQQAVAFRNLAAAAGGAGDIAAYCAAVPHPGRSHSSHPAPSHPAGQPSDLSTTHPTGKPSSVPTTHPTGKPSSVPTTHPTGKPSSVPTP